MKLLKIFMAGFLMVAMVSCQTGSGVNALVVKRIQYDVPIISGEEGGDWWVNNLEGSVREEMLKAIFEKAYSGSTTVYDYFHNPLSPSQARAVGTDTVYLTFRRDTAPYEEYDTMVVTNITYRDVSKLRFLEEWTLDNEDLRMEKRVVGMAPVFVRKYGEASYNQVLFWFYFDEDYPEALRD